MKRLLFAFLIVSQILHAQQKSFIIKNGLLTVENIDTLIPLKKDKIYQTTKQWIAKSFGSAKSVIDLDDLQAGTIILKYNFDTKSVDTIEKTKKPILIAFHNKATMQIDCRDNKIRITVSGFQSAIDLSKVLSDFNDTYHPLEENFARMMENGETLVSFSGRKIYRAILWETNDLAESLFKALRDASKDDF